MTYMIDSLDRDIKSYYNTILYVQKIGEGLNMVNGDTKDILQRLKSDF